MVRALTLRYPRLTMRLTIFLAASAILAAGADAAQVGPRGVPYVIDPVNARIYEYCRSEPGCIRRQHAGIQLFLARITAPPRPTSDVVQRCMKRSTKDHGRVTDWMIAARCVK